MSQFSPAPARVPSPAAALLGILLAGLVGCSGPTSQSQPTATATVQTADDARLIRESEERQRRLKRELEEKKKSAAEAAEKRDRADLKAEWLELELLRRKAARADLEDLAATYEAKQKELERKALERWQKHPNDL